MNNLPLVSILIPIRNETAYIERCINAIQDQDYPGEMEILIIDGQSTDKTRDTLRQLALDPSVFTILDNPGEIVPIGINIALRQTKGKIIIRVDGHCIIAPDYVSNCVRHLQTDNVDGVGGPMKTIGETPLAKIIALAMGSPFGVGNSAFRTISGTSMLTDTIPFPAYTRQIIERAGLYDEELKRNQDDEYNYRIRALGGKILLAADVQSTYFSRASLQKLWKQYLEYGYYKVRVLQKHPRQMSARQFIPPIFVFCLIISGFLFLSYNFHSSPAILYLSSFTPLAYIIANLAASLWTIYSNNKNISQFSLFNHLFFVTLPIAFIILHISYGLGFLLGLFHFWNRWRDTIGKVPTWENL